MRIVRIAILSLLVWSGQLLADDPRAVQVDAAMANGVGKLLSDVRAQPLGGITVGNLLDQTHATDELLVVLSKAQQIGGPRWLDEQTCQVRLEIPSATVAQALVDIAMTHPTSPLLPPVVQNAANHWQTRTFAAVGTSVGNIESVHPLATNLAWRDVSDDAIHQAIVAARQDAIQHVLDSLGPIPLAGDKTIHDALAIPEVGNGMAQWLAARPVTLVDFRDDRTVQISLLATPAEVMEHLRTVIAGRNDVPQLAPQVWQMITAQASHAMAPPVGVGSAAATTRPTALALPPFPPEWVREQLDAEGKSGPIQAGGQIRTQLRAARDAQADAMTQLQQKVYALPIDTKSTLGDLAQHDPHMAKMIQRSLDQQSHLYRTEYHPDGSVNVRMSINLRDVWERMVPAQ